MSFQPELIAFDLDGTLIDSAPDLVEAVNFALTSLGHSPHKLDDIRQWIGNGADVLIKRSLARDWHHGGHGDFEPAFELFKQYYAAHSWVNSTLYEGAENTLKILFDKSIPLACITNKTSPFTLPLLDTAQLSHYFAFVASGDTFHEMKPSPLPLLETAKLLGANPENSLMVGDSVNDIVAGQKAGFKTVLVTYGYVGQHSFDELKADYQISCLTELLSIVK